jgi:hypothetical protein
MTTHPDTRLEVISQDIALPGCTLTPNALIVTHPSEETFKHVARYLQTVEACRAWWWGDYLNAYCAVKIAALNASQRKPSAMDEAAKEHVYVHYTAGFAAVSGVEETTLRHWRMVSAFFEVGSRLPTLSWSHHHEAWSGASGNRKQAAKWLAKAQAEGWSKTELRAHIRGEAITEDDPSTPPPIRMQELIACSRWARGMVKQLSALKPADLQTIRPDLEPVVQLAKQIDARLGGKA